MIKAKERPLESKSLLDKKQCCIAQENVTVGIMLNLEKKKKNGWKAQESVTIGIRALAEKK